MAHLFKRFHLHGDNIVECERTVTLIRAALKDIIKQVRGPYGSPVCPSYEITVKDDEAPITLVLYPGFGRWDRDILELIRQRGGTLREAADTVITGVADGKETPLLAIEYCGALPAGNQAWQRNGRAYSFSKAEVPYLYVAELGGFELDANRVRKAARLPNPAVPFSYVALSLDNPTVALPVFITSPGADAASRAMYADVFAEKELLGLIQGAILGKDDDTSIDALRIKALSFVEKRAASSKKTLTPKQWQSGYELIKGGGSLVNFLADNVRLPWAKVAYIETITPTARELMNFVATVAFGLTASDLPMCVVPKENRAALADKVEQLGNGRIQSDFLAWLRQDRHLSICWVMGFKPRGDDARPDRGLPPLTRMLIGPDADLLTVIYGPAPSATWSLLHTNPRQLGINNGLWQAILSLSDGILVDSSTDGIRRHGYLRSHWHREQPKPDVALLLVKPSPLHIGENDVDTVLHLLLAHDSSRLVFEGMCNPPGGDWSGISFQTLDRQTELRWLSLPRVSVGGKRPDHVFQLFPTGEQPIILAVESKETASSVEVGVGPRLISYIETLIRTPASIERTPPAIVWQHSNLRLDTNQFAMVNAVAFKADTEERIDRVKNSADTDLLMSFSFGIGENDSTIMSCSIRLIPVTDMGQKVATFISKLSFPTINIRISID